MMKQETYFNITKLFAFTNSKDLIKASEEFEKMLQIIVDFGYVSVFSSSGSEVKSNWAKDGIKDIQKIDSRTALINWLSQKFVFDETDFSKPKIIGFRHC